MPYAVPFFLTDSLYLPTKGCVLGIIVPPVLRTPMLFHYFAHLSQGVQYSVLIHLVEILFF